MTVNGDHTTSSTGPQDTEVDCKILIAREVRTEYI